jgi:hypothetical protein
MDRIVYKITLSYSLYICGELQTSEIFLIFERHIIAVTHYHIIELVLHFSMVTEITEMDFPMTKIINIEFCIEQKILKFLIDRIANDFFKALPLS